MKSIEDMYVKLRCALMILYFIRSLLYIFATERAVSNANPTIAVDDENKK